ncbi:DUF6146 family protein [Plebeiibacterium marinum]|uniref:DUF6146 family protein n=1 Tax=Plebeiibacterium marinum TaxID=2992111 RepID=A0AAE3MBZ7_9BACT|nr:DUF6146 family protein [Plebeiobacterium marinum]MCW3804362.1 DUF6146 family protein [Plebeiobacterium marinum]
MKTSVIIIALTALLLSCQTKQFVSDKNNTLPQINQAKEDSVQYELIIYDIKFDTYLATRPPMEFFSQQYYETWNYQYVTEWNIRHLNPTRYGDFFETHIEYYQHMDYGLELNYKLYYYFLFIEKEYGIKLIRRAKNQ